MSTYFVLLVILGLLLASLVLVWDRVRRTSGLETGQPQPASSASPTAMGGLKATAVAVTAEEKVVLISAESGEVIRTLYEASAEVQRHTISVAATPDDKTAYVSFVTTKDCGEIVSIDLSTGSATNLKVDGHSAAVSADGTKLAYANVIGPGKDCKTHGLIVREITNGKEMFWPLQGDPGPGFSGIYSLSWSSDSQKVALSFGNEGGVSNPMILDVRKQGNVLDAQKISPSRSGEIWANPEFVSDGLAVLGVCCDQSVTRDITKDPPHRLVQVKNDGTESALMDFPQKVSQFDHDPSGAELMWVTGEGVLYRSRRDGTEQQQLGTGFQFVSW